MGLDMANFLIVTGAVLIVAGVVTAVFFLLSLQRARALRARKPHAGAGQSLALPHPFVRVGLDLRGRQPYRGLAAP